MVAAVHFAAAFQEVQGPVARVMKSLQPQHNPDVRRCAVACACALAPCLPRHQVGHTQTDDTLCNTYQALAWMSSSLLQVTDHRLSPVLSPVLVIHVLNTPCVMLDIIHAFVCHP